MRNRGAVEEKGKKSSLRKREVMGFDPKPCVLHGQKKINKYLMMYVARLLSRIEVEWCSPVTPYFQNTYLDTCPNFCSYFSYFTMYLFFYYYSYYLVSDLCFVDSEPARV